MEGHIQEGRIEYQVQNLNYMLRFYYTFNKEEIKVRLNYRDLAQLVRATNARNLQPLNIDFGVELEMSSGENLIIKFKIPEHIMRESADELEERSRN